MAAKDDYTRAALPVMWAEQSLADMLKGASTTGTMDLGGGHFLDPNHLVQAMSITDMDTLTDAGVLIINALPDPLTLSTVHDVDLQHLFFPALSDGTHWDKESAHQIPAARPNPLNPGEKVYGVGFYGYKRNNGWVMPWGALEFSIEGRKPVALAFQAPHWFVTADSSSYADASDFYSKTLDAGKHQESETGSDSTVQCCYHSGSDLYVLWVGDAKTGN